MEIIGVGVDLVEVVRVERAIRKWGERFLKHVFTPVEIAYCTEHVNNGVHFSARFAAKEAIRKAVGKSIKWTDVEIKNEGNGKPVMRLERSNSEWQIFLSMSHAGGYAIAYVIIQTTEPGLRMED